ncbi:hypothetical protein [Polyangium fumosum]|nr:hypothetical protein [Polyangium fumosum]
MLVKRMPDGSISDVYEFEDRYDLTTLTEERWTAYLEGFRRAFPGRPTTPSGRWSTRAKLRLCALPRA